MIDEEKQFRLNGSAGTLRSRVRRFRSVAEDEDLECKWLYALKLFREEIQLGDAREVYSQSSVRWNIAHSKYSVRFRIW